MPALLLQEAQDLPGEQPPWERQGLQSARRSREATLPPTLTPGARGAPPAAPQERPPAADVQAGSRGIRSSPSSRKSCAGPERRLPGTGRRTFHQRLSLVGPTGPRLVMGGQQRGPRSPGVGSPRGLAGRCVDKVQADCDQHWQGMREAYGKTILGLKEDLEAACVCSLIHSLIHSFHSSRVPPSQASSPPTHHLPRSPLWTSATSGSLTLPASSTSHCWDSCSGTLQHCGGSIPRERLCGQTPAISLCIPRAEPGQAAEAGKDHESPMPSPVLSGSGSAPIKQDTQAKAP